MSISNLPFGSPGGLQVLGLPILNTYPGNALWVNANGGNGGSRATRQRPVATIQAAVDLASAGDIILVHPAHTETITGAGALAIAKAGVQVIGLGIGGYRPKITWGSAATTVTLSAAGVALRNMRFLGGIADVVTGIIPSAVGITIADCTFEDSAVDLNFLTPIKVTATTTGTVDDLTIVGNRWLSADAASLQLLNCACTVDRLLVERNEVVHEGTDSALVKFATGKLFTRASIKWNFLSHKMTANELLVNNDGSTNSGIIAHNRVGHADVTTTHDLGIDGLGCRVFDNLSVSTDALSGLLLPAADVNS